MIAGLIRRAAHPFHFEDLVPGQEYSALEIATGRASLDRVETLFAQGGDVDRVVVAHQAFFDDADAERALKKGLHVTLEGRYRIAARLLDKPEAYGFDGFSLPQPDSPLDELVAEDRTFPRSGQKRLTVAVPFRNRLRHFVSALLWLAVFIGSTTATLLRHGRSQVSRPKCWLISPPFWPGSRWNAFERAFVEAGAAPGETIAFVVETEEDAGFSPGPYRKYHLRQLALPWSEWLRKVLLPGLSLAARVVSVLLRHPGDAFIVELCRETMLQATQSLRAWHTAMSLDFRFCLDIYEYSAAHAVKAMVFRRFGAGIARLPHSQMDSDSSALSFLSYDLVMLSGKYLDATYGSSWNPKRIFVAVGQMQADDRLRQQPPDNRYRDRIEEACRSGRKIAAFFGSSTVHGMHSVCLDSLSAVERLLAGKDDWLLVVKPKGQDIIYEYMKRDPRFQERAEYVETVSIHYDRLGDEPCPVGWLIDKMDVGFGVPASTQIEALTHGKPFVSYHPLPGETLLQHRLHDIGLRHATIDGFERAAAMHIAREPAPAIDYDWFRENFDPFNDGRALSRIAAALSVSAHTTHGSTGLTGLDIGR